MYMICPNFMFMSFVKVFMCVDTGALREIVAKKET